MPEASEMRVLVRRGRRINFFLARERNRGFLFHETIQCRAAVIKAKAKRGHLARRGRRHAIIATSLDSLDGIAHRGRDPRVKGPLSPLAKGGR